MSIPPNVSWPSMPSRSRSASRTIPAHVPNVGMPVLTRSATASNTSKVRASLAIVVDSPPGRISASTRSSSLVRRTAMPSRAQTLERREMLAHVALQRQHTNGGQRHGSRLCGLRRRAGHGLFRCSCAVGSQAARCTNERSHRRLAGAEDLRHRPGDHHHWGDSAEAARPAPSGLPHGRRAFPMADTVVRVRPLRQVPSEAPTAFIVEGRRHPAKVRMGMTTFLVEHPDATFLVDPSVCEDVRRRRALRDAGS